MEIVKTWTNEFVTFDYFGWYWQQQIDFVVALRMYVITWQLTKIVTV